jgi:Zn-finger domain-containing protein
MKETIQYKSELETKIKNLHLKPNQEAIGAVALHNKNNISLNKAADLLHVSQEDAIKEKNNLKQIEKPTTKKAKKFLELINK